ncbi:conserved oligomeric Golgi complex subunit 2-like [Physella acuta]|uniref:conserved oligomeric Golgi complex subunit 2-like n=1 Tax=Physella acuta TaxID=109671 RepID=UPI0027DC57AD|nr:conserved oligomeric Golgi complex subunit 2-like [Physella acuta]
MTVDVANKTFTLPSGPATLCFDKEEFMKKDFEVDKFIMDCKKKVPLETLRDDLDLYLKVIRSAMIELINKDYADFVNLSTNLVGMDKAITNLTTPLGQLKEEVLSVQTAMDEAIKGVQEKIRQQQEIQRKKAVLQRLMNITASVEKIEKLLGIKQGTDTDTPGELTGPLIERVATEFNKLQFYVTRSKGLPLVDKVKPRIAAITTTLQFSLEGSFLSGLETENAGMLRQCLRTYALIDKTHDAESLFQEHIVHPYMEEVISEEFLRHHNKDISVMFDHIVAFFPEKCSILTGITTGTSGDIVRGYDFIVNAVLPEVVKNLELKTPSIFAPGNPDVFHKKYNACMKFLDDFEQCCGSLASVKRLRQHPSYSSLLGKWSLPVYFQIRFQDIAGSFETSLATGFNNVQGDFHLQSSNALWTCLNWCWREDIFLPALTHRFVKLNLQLLSRYKTWLNEVYQEEFVRKTESVTETKPRSSTPDILNSPTTTTDIMTRSMSPKPTHMQDLVQRPALTTGQVVALMADMDKLVAMIPLLYENEIKTKLVSVGHENPDLVKVILSEEMSSACECRPRFWSMVTEDIIKRCSVFLNQVNDIPRLYRRTNKEVPTKQSTYLSSVIKPLTQFCAEHSNALNQQQKVEFLGHVFTSLTQQFSEVTCEVLTSTKKMEESLRRLKKARGGEKEKEKSGFSDSDKIRTQLIIDIRSFHKQMEDFGIQPENIEGYSKLSSLAEDAQADITSSSS